mmetsp:Transcript_5891/g.9549  ORF Transcript_5891/g.9549 Transcript_5891/m.9549 type:complete len:135 (+) Transcript_5891:2239-2643(+)|eukprot:CAMPEP_0170486688 /NCGR_PEP_ID=MMETSP0208-20121228/5639_1 /TAXON_ID=197538 /ORGANISM="Strombidium inclinatum, Strain S3" /LENGTH=134 /DNA_ID=CAMNT_0010760701 /DNA_START=2156 /DNA_END=2560 /DNA_ORIENTATION=+
MKIQPHNLEAEERAEERLRNSKGPRISVDSGSKTNPMGNILVDDVATNKFQDSDYHYNAFKSEMENVNNSAPSTNREGKAMLKYKKFSESLNTRKGFADILKQEVNIPSETVSPIAQAHGGDQNTEKAHHLKAS